MLNFLKELPDKYLMLMVFVLIFAAYLTSHLSMLEQLTFMAFGGLTTLLGVRRLQNSAVTTDTGDVTVNQPVVGDDAPEPTKTK